MGAVVDLDRLLEQRRVWRGRQAQARPLGLQPTGHAALDERLPEGGWPAAALSELLLANPGCGELQLLWPTLARLSAEASRVVLVAPPFIPFAPAWQAAGWTCAGWYRWMPSLPMPCGLPNSACARAVARRCCAGRNVPMTAPCGACR